MAILTLQRRARELGRIRMGQFVKPAQGKARPEKLDRFRFTSSSQPLIERIAELYGGEVKAWQPQGGGAPGWEVIVQALRLPVLVPPQPVSQFFELWAGGGCQRRCDGVTELLQDRQCVCSPDPEERECKPTTRLNVVLRDVEGIGVFRLETHGYYAATELPETAEFLAQTKGYVAAHLALEERVVKRDGKTKRFMVPTLEVDLSPAALMSGQVPDAPQISAGAAHIDAKALPPSADPGPQPVAVEPPKVEPIPVKEDETLLLPAIQSATTLDQLRRLWRDTKGQLSPETREAFTARVEYLNAQVETTPTEDPDELWSRVLRTVPASWTTGQTETDFEAVVGVEPGEASAAQIQEYLDVLKTEDGEESP